MIRQHSGGSRKYDNDYLKQMLAENSTQTQKVFAEQLGVMHQIIVKRPHKMGKIQKKRKMDST